MVINLDSRLKLLSRHSLKIGLFLTLLLLWPLARPGYFTHHLDHQIVRIWEIDRCLKDWQIPCRWAPDLGGFYGIPLFNYLAPLPYYLGEIFYLLSGNLIFAYKLDFALAFIASFVFMYLLGKKLWGSLGGTLCATLYSFAPYQAVTLYVRGDLGQLWSLAILPGLVWSILRLRDSVRIINVLIVTALMTFLILSHNLFAFLFLPIVLLFAVVFRLQQRSQKLLRFVGIAVLASLLASSFYLIPATLETDLIHDPTISWPNLAYTEHFKGLRKLIIERSWGWGSSVREVPGVQESEMSFQIGWAHLLVWAAALFGLKLLQQKSQARAMLVVLSSAAVLVTVFLIHPKSEFVWKVIWPLKYFQLPWQLLAVVTFFISLMAGSVIYSRQRPDSQTKLWLVLMALAVGLNFSYFKPEKLLPLSGSQVTAGEYWQYFVRKSNFETLPRETKTPPKQLGGSKYEIVWGEAEISNFSQGTNWINLDIEAKKLTILRLSQHYFPGWKVQIDGKEVEVNPQNELGLITFAVDPGKHRVEARLFDTPYRTVGNLMSLAGVLIFLLLVMTQIPRTRRWLGYYAKSFNR